MSGITLKQYHRQRFLKLCAAYKEAQQHLDTEEGKHQFVVLSLQVHAAKSQVPKSMWRYAK